MNFYITKKEAEVIASTPHRDSMFTKNISKDEEGYFLPEEIFEDYGIEEHLEQIINRELIFK